MSRPPSDTELASQFRSGQQRHMRISAEYNRLNNSYHAVDRSLQQKQDTLNEEDRLCKHPSTRRAYRDNLRREISELQTERDGLRRQLTRVGRSLRMAERTMRGLTRYVKERELLGHIFPSEIASMIAAYNYRRIFPEDDDDL